MLVRLPFLPLGTSARARWQVRIRNNTQHLTSALTTAARIFIAAYSGTYGISHTPPSWISRTQNLQKSMGGNMNDASAFFSPGRTSGQCLQQVDMLFCSLAFRTSLVVRLLLMIEILHDPMYQSRKNSGSTISTCLYVCIHIYIYTHTCIHICTLCAVGVYHQQKYEMKAL